MEVQMKQAKASKEDIKSLIDFFQMWELMEGYDWRLWHYDLEDDWGHDKEVYRNLKPYVLKEGYEGRDESVLKEKEAMVRERFFDEWRGKVGHRWMRVVFGADILINQVCDPDVDHLALNPKLFENEKP